MVEIESPAVQAATASAVTLDDETSTVPEKMFSDYDLAKLFGVTVITIRKWIEHGELPAPIVFGSRRFWHPHVIVKILTPSSNH